MSRRVSKSTSRGAKQEPVGRAVPHRHPRSDDGNAFIPDPEDGPARTSDDLAENLAEEYLQGATSGGEPMAEEQNDEVVPEELGGPFVETSGREEFADGTDESNPADAERAPLPLTGPGIAATPREDQDEVDD
ncbi:MAG TPA: hypothetical protein VFH68_24255 [Polyangia bacterium]|jgi:hypothetical protein|nr:hypothetical protein [Polyangia bacterium]